MPASPASALRILKTGRNCWRVAETERAAVLIDAADYFARLAESLARAERSIIIVGWDFDGRIPLRPDRPPGEQCPLGPFLRSLVEEKPLLEVRILVWSVAVVHAPGSPVELLLGSDWQNHPRIQLKLDTEHPVYAAHHQKIVAIDDRLAFVGGIDLTVERWDTPDHRPDDPARRDPDGRPYPPVHDVHMVVDGEAALAVAEVARDRWRIATGHDLVAESASSDPWPSPLRPDFVGTPVAVSRTAPGWGGAPAYAEGAVLTADALNAAQGCIYIETQYLTADFVGQILVDLLRNPSGPDVVIVLTRKSHGFAERWVMGHNRDHLLRRLKRADRWGRLRVYHPVVSGEDGPCEILVHSKLVIVDDVLLRVGSSNLNNRSIALDTECDLAIEAGDETTRAAISRVRNRLVGEHLGVSADTVRAAIEESGSLAQGIDRLNGGERRLQPFEIDLGRAPRRPVLGTALFDPKRPFRLLRPLMRLLSSVRAPSLRRHA